MVQGIERGVYVVDKIQFNQVIEEFIKVNNLMTHIQKRPIRITNDLKLSTSMIHLIDVIGNYPETSITELADRLGVTKGAVSQQIPTLEKMNLISISQKKGNKKTKLVSLTKYGRKVYESHNYLHEELYSSINEALESFSQDQISTIKQILEKVSYTINEYQVSLTRKED